MDRLDEILKRLSRIEETLSCILRQGDGHAAAAQAAQAAQAQYKFSDFESGRLRIGSAVYIVGDGPLAGWNVSGVWPTGGSNGQT